MNTNHAKHKPLSILLICVLALSALAGCSAFVTADDTEGADNGGANPAEVLQIFGLSQTAIDPEGTFKTTAKVYEYMIAGEKRTEYLTTFYLKPGSGFDRAGWLKATLIAILEKSTDNALHDTGYGGGKSLTLAEYEEKLIAYIFEHNADDPMITFSFTVNTDKGALGYSISFTDTDDEKYQGKTPVPVVMLKIRDESGNYAAE